MCKHNTCFSLRSISDGQRVRPIVWYVLVRLQLGAKLGGRDVDLRMASGTNQHAHMRRDILLLFRLTYLLNRAVHLKYPLMSGL